MSAGSRTVRTDGQRVLEVRGRVFGDAFGKHLLRGVLPEGGTWYEIRPARLIDGVGWRVRLDPPPGSDRTEVCLVDD